MAKCGLIIGKFYPPHRGHHHLIETAQVQVEALVALVCEKPEQPIPGALRAAWLREVHPGVDVQVVPDILEDDDSAGWADYTRRWLGYTPDVVFTSEDYGDRYAHYLGCRHVQVDHERRHMPISGTAVRNHPLAHWALSRAVCTRLFCPARLRAWRGIHRHDYDGLGAGGALPNRLGRRIWPSVLDGEDESARCPDLAHRRICLYIQRAMPTGG